MENQRTGKLDNWKSRELENYRTGKLETQKTGNQVELVQKNVKVRVKISFSFILCYVIALVMQFPKLAQSPNSQRLSHSDRKHKGYFSLNLPKIQANIWENGENFNILIISRALSFSQYLVGRQVVVPSIYDFWHESRVLDGEQNLFLGFLIFVPKTVFLAIIAQY